MADAATACKAQAASQYASGEQPARVKFKGVYGGNDSRKVRMQVLPADGGRAFLAICDVNGRTGETMGSVPVQQWKLLLAAITVGTFLETIALWIIGSSS